MPIRRHFIDWHQPALRAAAEFMADKHAAPRALDLEKVIVAVRGGRVGRRLLELLVEIASQRKLALVPPKIVTVGALPEQLYELKQPTAFRLTQQLAWVRALKQLSADELHPLSPRLPASDDLEGWLALADLLRQVHNELAADRLDFSQVAEHGAECDGFAEAARWQTLADIQQRYWRVLDGLGLWDVQTARIEAIKRREPRTDCDIYLVGTADLDGAQRAILDAVADRVTALIFAPEDHADRFDEHGCLIAEAWKHAILPLDVQRIVVTDGPREQAEAVVAAIASWGGRYAAEEVTVGLADARLAPYLEQRLEECELAARYGAGSVVSRSGPYQLLQAVAEYIERRDFAALAALVRHPAITAWLLARGLDFDFLSHLDDYATRHLPARVDRWLTDSRKRNRSREVHREIESLTAGLAGGARLVADWNEPILDLLVAIYGRKPLVRDDKSDRSVIEACTALSDALEEHRQVDARLSEKISAVQAIRMALARVAADTIPPPADTAAIELLGWLELPLDDAPALVVAGFNEGFVPSHRNGDLFLPNELRRRLALEDNDRRYARDAYALAVLIASRRELTIVAGRRTAENDPLLPSRLLFACPREELPERTRALLAPERRPVISVAGKLRAAEQSGLVIPHPVPLTERVASMRVTEFKDYLACKYRYYLRHQLDLQGLSDRFEELEANAFGSLLHEVLGEFGKDDVRDTAEPERIADFFDRKLAEVVDRTYGTAPLAAVAVQVEQVRLRLHQFARWQAKWRADGWRIAHAELPFDAAPFEVDGETMLLRGRVDRIDVHETTGEWIVLDYKTGDTLRTPEQTHRDADGWVDLQLPLYRYLVATMSPPERIRLGYIVLPKEIAKVGHHEASWTDDELRTADAVAKEIVRQVWAEDFWPPVDEPPAFCEDLAAICHDNELRPAAAALDEAEEAAS